MWTGPLRAAVPHGDDEGEGPEEDVGTLCQSQSVTGRPRSETAHSPSGQTPLPQNRQRTQVVRDQMLHGHTYCEYTYTPVQVDTILSHL